MWSQTPFFHDSTMVTGLSSGDGCETKRLATHFSNSLPSSMSFLAHNAYGHDSAEESAKSRIMGGRASPHALQNNPQMILTHAIHQTEHRIATFVAPFSSISVLQKRRLV